MDSVHAHIPQANSPVDVSELLARCLGRIDLVERILWRFHQTLEADLAQIEVAAEMLRADEVARIAHRIKGASLAVSAPVLTSCAQDLEAVANEHRWDGIAVALAKLKREGSRFGELHPSQFVETPSNC
jgi:HPt (histidine-containing phosphotransfer) domain-containing protein